MAINVNNLVRRYLPAEIAGGIGALGGAGVTIYLSGNQIMAAYVGVMGENIGYYGAMLFRDIRAERARTGGYPLRRHIRSLAFEFGFSEMIDSFLSRPFFMFIFPQILGDFVLGTLTGKLVADCIFYVPTVFAHEMRRRYLNN